MLFCGSSFHNNSSSRGVIQGLLELPTVNHKRLGNDLRFRTSRLQTRKQKSFDKAIAAVLENSHKSFYTTTCPFSPLNPKP